jgi:hypothetical protein
MTAQVNTGGSALPIIAMHDCFDRIMGLPDAKDWAGEIGKAMDEFRSQDEKQQAEKAEKRKSVRTTRGFDEFEGTYYNDPYGAVKVQTKNGKQTIVMFEGRHELENWHYDVFTAHVKMDMSELPLEVNFITGQDGGIESLEIALEGPPVKPSRFTKILKDTAGSTKEAQE